MTENRTVYKDISDLRCPACNRQEFRFRYKSRDYRCRVCGTVFEAYYEGFELKTRIKENPI